MSMELGCCLIIGGNLLNVIGWSYYSREKYNAAIICFIVGIISCCVAMRH